MTKRRKKNLYGTNEFKPPYLFYFKDASPACYSKVHLVHISMPELFFLVERRWNTLCNFQTDENIALLYLERIKKNHIYLNSHRYFVDCCLNTSEQKSNASVPVVSLAAVVWSPHTMPFVINLDFYSTKRAL